MKRSALFIIIFLFNNYCIAQDASFVWAKTLGSTDFDGSRNTVRDACGDIICTGYFKGTVDVDPGPAVHNFTSNGDQDIFIAKYDATGDLIWARQIGTNLRDDDAAVKTDVSGNIFFTGSFTGTFDFDPGPGSATLGGNGSEIIMFLLKLDSDGEFEWVKQLSNNSYISSTQILTIASSGNIFVAGSFEETTDVDPGPAVLNFTASGTDKNSFITKLDPDGNLIWSKQFTGTYVFAKSVEVDMQENIFIAGDFGGTCDFDPGPATNLFSSNFPHPLIPDIFLVKLDQNGIFSWARKIGGYEGDDVWRIVLDANSNIYMTGYFYGSADFDPGPGLYELYSWGGDFSCFVMKLSNDGNFLWAQRYGGNSFPRGYCGGFDIALDKQGYVYITGSFGWTVEFTPTVTLTSLNGGDMFISKLDGDGNLIFLKQFPCSMQMSGRSIFLDDARNIYISGSTWGVVDFDPGPGIYNPPTYGNNDVFLLKLRQCEQTSFNSITQSVCKNYTLNCHTYDSTGVYTQILVNKAGCDSVITLNLTVDSNKLTPMLGLDKEVCNGSSEALSVLQPNNFIRYQWSTGASQSSITVQDPGVYWVKVKDVEGCIGTDTVRIIPKQCVIDLFIPTAFTPNGDMLNNTLKPRVYGTLASFKLEIYNRYGQMIFRSTDPNNGWDGTFKGTSVPTGVFVWQCTYQFMNKGIENQKGTVTVFR